MKGMRDMKKKKIFKKWVQVLIGVVMLIAMLVATGECETTMLFIGKEIISMVIISICAVLLKKHTNLFESEDVL